MALCQRAKTRKIDKCEKHHILPKSFGLGGEKDPVNLVELSLREHFICHLLLPKFLVNAKHRSQMLHAANRMVTDGRHTSKRYESVRLAHRKAMSDARRNVERPDLRGKKRSEEWRARQRVIMRDLPRKVLTSEQREQARIRKLAWLTLHGPYKHTELDLQRMCKPKSVKAVCNRCGFVGSVTNVKRWHDDNCVGGTREYKKKDVPAQARMVAVGPVTFNKVVDAARHYGVTPTTIINWIKDPQKPHRYVPAQ